MIKTVRKLICDHCGREIKEDEQYITESTCLTLYRWDGNLGILNEEQPSEHSTRDLCSLCYLKLYGDADGREQQAPADEAKPVTAKTEEPMEVTLEVSPEFNTACAQLAERSKAFTRMMQSKKETEAAPEAADPQNITPQTIAEPAILEIPAPETTEPERLAQAEDVATGETVEMEGKTYTEYHRPEEPALSDSISPDLITTYPIIPDPIIPDPETQEPETPETPLEAREAAARILAMAEKKPRKRLTREQKEQITKRMKQGKSCAETGKELGIPAQTVWNVWHKYKEEHDGK